MCLAGHDPALTEHNDKTSLISLGRTSPLGTYFLEKVYCGIINYQK